jgi:hypothetical protein
MFAAGALGWVDDDLAFVQPWGFDLQELRVPVEIRYGITDVLVPAAHGTWLAAHVPGAEVFVDEHGGHLSTPDQRPRCPSMIHRFSGRATVVALTRRIGPGASRCKVMQWPFGNSNSHASSSSKPSLAQIAFDGALSTFGKA